MKVEKTKIHINTRRFRFQKSLRRDWMRSWVDETNIAVERGEKEVFVEGRVEVVGHNLCGTQPLWDTEVLRGTRNSVDYGYVESKTLRRIRVTSVLLLSIHKH